MTRLRLALLLPLGLLAIGPGRAGAQAPSLTVETPGGGVTILADRLEQVGPDNLFVATGNVEVTHGTTRLLADRVELNRETGDAVAQGKVVFYDGENRLTGRRIDYNVKTGTGVVYDAEARSAPYYRVSGERMERLGENVYRVRRGVFTTCEGDPPAWSFHAGSATADLEDFVYGSNASFWVKSIPVIPWFPFFAAAIRRERQTGFLFPRLGTSTRKGTFVQIPFFWAISDSQDATLGLDVYTKRGVGAHAEYRYVLSEAQRGAVTGFFIRETLRDNEDRGVGGFKHDWQIAPGLSFRADLNGVSDDRVLREYGDRLEERATQRVESNVFFTRRWENWNLTGNVLWYQDLTTRRPVELQRAPEIRLEGVRQPIPGLPGFLYQMEAGAVRFLRDAGSDGARVDAHPIVSRPISAAGYFTVTPFVGGRVTAYDRTVTGLHTPRAGGPAIEETNDDIRVRRYAEIGGDFESRASRVFSTGGLGGFDTVLHAIEPHVRYVRVTGQGFSRLPDWTTRVDRIPQTSWLEYAVTNRLHGKTISPPGTDPTRLEVLRVTVAHAYEMAEERVGNAFGELLVKPSPVVDLRGDLSYNIEGGGVQTATTDAAVKTPIVTANVGTRYSTAQPIVAPEFVNVPGTYRPPGPFDRGASVNFLQGGLTSELGRHLVGHFKTNLDLKTETFVENRFAVDFRFECWAVTVEYVNRARDSVGGGEDEVRFAINLLGLGGPIGTRLGGFGDGASGARLK